MDTDPEYKGNLKQKRGMSINIEKGVNVRSDVRA